MNHLLLTCLLLVPATVTNAADLFDRHTLDLLKKAAGDIESVPALSMRDSLELKPLSRRIDRPCIVVRTDSDNWARALLGWGFLKRGEELVPVAVIERFVTYRGDRDNATTAHGRNVMLFPGFAFDFDRGQVVPEGFGADLEFDTEKGIVARESVGLHPLSGSLLKPSNADGHDPLDHDGVLSRDFVGTWQINVDGRWKGELELKIGGNDAAFGTYTSDESKSGYHVSGRFNQPNRIRLTIHLDNAQQTVDAYLWTTDKSAMAGTAELAGRKFGFYASRKPAGK